MKKKVKISLIIRIILSIAMIYGIYTETGIVTTIFAALVTVYIEVSSINVDKLYRFLNIK